MKATIMSIKKVEVDIEALAKLWPKEAAEWDFQTERGPELFVAEAAANGVFDQELADAGVDIKIEVTS